MNLSNTVVFVGECGDTDYEELVGGIHKTVIMKGIGCDARKLYSDRNYPLEDVLPLDNPNVLQAETKDIDAMKASLKKLGVSCQ